MPTLVESLEGVTKLGVDTAPIIYFVEANPNYNSLVSEVFGLISNGTITGVTSSLTLTETLALPFRLGNFQLAQEYSELLRHSSNFSLVSIDADVAQQAAEIRARHQLRTPDALQLAAAISEECEAFLTNDISFRRVTEIKTLVLEDFKT